MCDWASLYGPVCSCGFGFSLGAVRSVFKQPQQDGLKLRAVSRSLPKCTIRKESGPGTMSLAGISLGGRTIIKKLSRLPLKRHTQRNRKTNQGGRQRLRVWEARRRRNPLHRCSEAETSMVRCLSLGNSLSLQRERGLEPRLFITAGVPWRGFSWGSS